LCYDSTDSGDFVPGGKVELDGKNGKVVFLRLPPFFGKFFTHPQECQVPFSVAYSAACLQKAGFEVSLNDQWAREESPRRMLRGVLASQASMLVLHVDSMNRDIVMDTAWAVRRHCGLALPMVAIGQYADVFPESLVGPTGPFDVAVMGEPELTLVDVARAVAAADRGVVPGADFSGISGIVWTDRVKAIRNGPRPLVEDLDSLPMPAWGLFNLDDYAKLSAYVPVAGRVRWGWIMSSRGCPFGCVFCSPTLRKSHGRRYRVHSPAYVVDMVERLVRDFGCNAIAFEDDVFSLDRERTMAICREIDRRGLKVFWTAQTHLATLDEELIAAMARAGCRGLCAGVESGDEDIRRSLKGGSLDDRTLLQNAALLRKNGIELTAYFMVGCPGETIEQMKKTVEMARRIDPLMIQVAFFTPYPGSEAWDRYMVGGIHEPEMSHYNRFGVNLSAADSKSVERLHDRFYQSFYLSPRRMFRYATRRLPYVLLQSRGREFKLLFNTLVYLLAPIHSMKMDSMDSVRRL